MASTSAKLLDGADSGENDRATSLRPEGMVIHVAPDSLDRKRVLAKDKLLHQLFDHGRRGGSAGSVRHRGIANSGNALIREQLDEDGITPVNRDDEDPAAGDFGAA